ncbi:MAG TPA: hypothetical protein VF053_11880 [Streptosporangiales bacterium]
MTGPETDPLRRTLHRLVDEGTLSAAQAQRVDAELRAAGLGARAGADAGRSVPVEVLSYVGAALVVGGLTLVVGLSWSALGLPGRVAVCTAITALLLAVAAVVGRWPGAPFGPRRNVVTSVVAVLASIAAGIAALQLPDALTESGRTPDGGLWGSVAFGTALVVVGLGAYLAWHAAPSVVGMFAGGVVVLLGVLTSQAAGRHDWPVVEVASFCYGAAWVGVGAVRLVCTPHAAAVLGGIAAGGSAEVLAAESDHALLGLGLGVLTLAAMFASFWRTRRWWYAALGVLTTLVVPPTAAAGIWHDDTVAAIVCSHSACCS